MSANVQNRIVVGFDGSQPSEHALTWAAGAAAARGLGLHILAARDGENSPDLAAEAVDRIRAQHPDLPVTGSAPVGSPRYLLAEASEQAAVVVVGNRGRSRWRAAILGTTSLSTAMHSACPVVIMRGNEVAVSPPGRIVVGVDGSGPSADAIDHALAVAADQAHINLVMAWSTAASDDQIPPFADDILRRTLGDRDISGINLTLSARAGHPVDVLSQLSGDADLLVIGRRGAEGFAGLAMGSTAAHVLNEASCPIMLVPPTKE